MFACKTFTPRIISVLAAFSMAGFFLCSCGDDETKTITSTEPIKEEPAPDTTTASKADSTDKASADSTTSTPDSAATVETTHTIFGYANRGQYFIGSEIVLRELDSTLAQTGIVHRSVIADTLGTFIFPDVKLTQPYVHIEVLGRFNSVCYESSYNGSHFLGSIESYADVRKGDTINLNVLTQMQAKRLPRYMDKGYSFDSAMSTLQSEISALLMLDTLHTDFNKLNLVTKQSESYYLLGATILAEAYIHEDKYFDQMLDHEVLNDSVTSGLWKQAYSAANDKDCWKITENSRKYGYHFIITDAKKYLNQVWVAKYALGECTAENQNEIKSPAFSSHTYSLMYCDSTKWEQSSGNCGTLDKIALRTFEGDTIAGHLNPAPYCEDVYYYWGTFQGEYMWRKADNIETGLNLACVDGTRGLYGKSGKKCYYCDGNYWRDKEMTECDEHIVSVGHTN